MTQLFVSRLFAHYCHGTSRSSGSNGGGSGGGVAGSAGMGMGFAAFAAFVAAWEGRTSCFPPVQAASLRYLFPLLDLQGAGALSPLDMRTLFREARAPVLCPARPHSPANAACILSIMPALQLGCCGGSCACFTGILLLVLCATCLLDPAPSRCCPAGARVVGEYGPVGGPAGGGCADRCVRAGTTTARWVQVPVQV